QPCPTAPAPLVAPPRVETLPKAPEAKAPEAKAPSEVQAPPTGVGGEAGAMFGGEGGAAGTGESQGLAAPNMMGNLLYANRAVSFFINRTQGAGFLFGSGTTNLINSKVADNNSPIPQDRIGFRYNFFHNSEQVTGLNAAPPPFDPTIGGTREVSA